MEFSLFLKATLNNVEYGKIVKKVHHIMSFNQSAWMKPYSSGYNDLRKTETMSFKKTC